MAKAFKPYDFEKKSKEILKLAEKCGVEKNYFFQTTFDRYLTQLRVLKQLKENIEKDGLTVKKEYVKGRKNVYMNPAVTEYNRTADSANKTVTVLLKIVKEFGEGGEKKAEDPLEKLLREDDAE